MVLLEVLHLLGEFLLLLLGLLRRLRLPLLQVAALLFDRRHVIRQPLRLIRQPVEFEEVLLEGGDLVELLLDVGQLRIGFLDARSPPLEVLGLLGRVRRLGRLRLLRGGADIILGDLLQRPGEVGEQRMLGERRRELFRLFHRLLQLVDGVRQVRIL